MQCSRGFEWIFLSRLNSVQHGLVGAKVRSRLKWDWKQEIESLCSAFDWVHLLHRKWIYASGFHLKIILLAGLQFSSNRTARHYMLSFSYAVKSFTKVRCSAVSAWPNFSRKWSVIFMKYVLATYLQVCCCLILITQSLLVFKKNKQTAKHTQISSYGLKSNWCLLKLNQILMWDDKQC